MPLSNVKVPSVLEVRDKNRAFRSIDDARQVNSLAQMINAQEAQKRTGISADRNTIARETNTESLAVRESIAKTASADRAATRQQGLRMHGDKITQRMHEVQMKLVDSSLDRASKERLQQMMLGLKQQQILIQGELQKGQQSLRSGQQDLLKDRQRFQEDKATEGKVEGLSKRFSSGSMLTSLMTAVDRINSLVGPYTQEGADGKITPKGDIPGLGLGTTVPGAKFLLSPEGKQIRASVQGAANDLLKLYSGGAVTLNEGERREIEMMSSGSFQEQDFLNAWPLITDRLNAAINNIKAGYKPEVVERYLSRGGVRLDERKPFKSLGAQASKADKFEVGKEYEDKNGSKATYLGNGKWRE